MWTIHITIIWIRIAIILTTVLGHTSCLRHKTWMDCLFKKMPSENMFHKSNKAFLLVLNKHCNHFEWKKFRFLLIRTEIALALGRYSWIRNNNTYVPTFPIFSSFTSDVVLPPRNAKVLQKMLENFDDFRMLFQVTEQQTFFKLYILRRAKRNT